MKIIVYHTFYGCDTGCCGHSIEDDEDNHSSFKFDHPYSGDFKEFAEKLVKEEYGEDHIKDLDWENCIIFDD